MAMILKNPGSTDITLPDFLNTMVPANGQIDISGYQKWQYQNSMDIVNNLISKALIFNDGATDFNSNEAINYIRGVYPNRTSTDDGKLYVVSSTRPLDQYYYISGAGDDTTNNVIGAGQDLDYNVAPGQSQSIDAAFTEDVMFLGGDVFYDSAEHGSWLRGEIVAPAGMPYVALDNNGNYDLVNGAWVANTTNTGGYFINSSAETTIFRFINKLALFGSSKNFTVKGPEPSKISKGYIVRVTIFNNSATANLTAQVDLEMFRRHTL